jgi:hypothetical protein
MINIKRIEDCFLWLEKEFEHSDEVQSIDVLIDKSNQLCGVLPWINQQMATAKKELNEAKVKAYHKLKTSSEANKEYYAPSLAKDYVNAQCSNENFAFDLAERCSRCIVHILDTLRTNISALKTERETSNYYQ